MDICCTIMSVCWVACTSTAMNAAVNYPNNANDRLLFINELLIPFGITMLKNRKVRVLHS